MSRNRVLEQGVSLIHRHGFTACSVQAITSAASVPKGSFYNYFDNKEAFAIAAIAYFRDATIELHRAALEKESLPATERLLVIFKEMVSLNRYNDYQSGCLLGNLAQELADKNEVIRHELRSAFAAIGARIAAVIELGQAEGSIRTDLKAIEIADQLLDSWQGALLRMKVEKSDRPLKRFLAGIERVLRT